MSRPRPALTRSIGAVFLALALLGLLNCAMCVYMLQLTKTHPFASHAAHDMAAHWMLLAVVDVILVAWGAWLLVYRIGTPIRRLREAVLRVGEGDYGVRVDEAVMFGELVDVSAAFNAMSSKIRSAVSHLELERNFSAGLLGRFPAGIAALDGEGEILFANPRFREIFSLGAGKIGKRPVQEIIPSAELAEMTEAARAGNKSFIGRRVDLMPPAVPGPIHLKISLLPIRRSAGPEKSMMIVENETEAVLMEHQRKEWQDMLIHDVKSPLTVVVSAAKILLDKEETAEDDRKMLEMVDRGTKRCLALLQTYFDVLRMEAGVLGAQRRKVRLAEAVREAVEDVNAQIRASGIRILQDVPAEITISADPDMLRRMIVNLLDNAIKYGGRGKEVGVRARMEGPAARLEVWDRGQGIPAQDLPRIFDRFYRTKKFGRTAGTGLGLSFCKLAAGLHGWEISVDSKEGRGTTFAIGMKTAEGSAEES